ncbi:TonB-dependent siderophore receptor [Shewanella loihica]|uniref:TonB-dependent receptor n=1 Tax=Shewanella loihica (strain ATCC BAA-1088 / PV-4) TaxID=323850 RepID=A3QEP2_SHELP|nr:MULTISPECIES: TonB-dependent receptor [Shewanella]ABO23940.1 TonB-dependent receptor [Shewanella loihica PV-4]QYJ80792.1 TonB-dependent receptor [Shewanella aegiceratis]QYK11284.1 TonB-dependent receptor [Shewanella rhizosphaerae]
MIKTSRLAAAVKLSLIATVSTSGYFVANNAVAAEESASFERIAVTGSRIQRQDMETASPVTVIDASAIRAEGYNSVDEILQAQPAMAGMAVGSTTNNGADGVAQVDLRGMGASRTLVLLNGRRMVNSGSGADSAVDLNTIPVAMIARVEILKDGASAVYGSDAIAGVVNIITKKDFEGFQLDINGGATDKGDGENVEISALYGFNTDGGNYTFGVAYSDRGGVMQKDRDWVEKGASSFIPTGSLGGKVQDENGNWVDRTEGYDFTQDSWLQTPNERYSFFANATQEFANEIVFTGDLLYTKRQSEQMMAAQPASVMLDVCTPTSTGNCITLTDEMVAGGITPDDQGRVEYRRRTTDAGNRIYEQDTDTLRVSAGLAGEFDVHTGIAWDLSYTYGKNKAETWVHNSINAKNMAQSVYDNQDAWFSGDPLSQAIVDDISYLESTTGGNEQHIVSGVISGEAFDLEAGPVAYAIGAEYRHDSGYYNPDPVIVAGEGTAAQQDPTDGSYSVVSVYQEVSVPFTDKLTGEFALRFDDYSTFGNASTWKIGLTYEATDDLMLRAVAATGFRAPNVSELFGGNVGSYDYLDDPWGNEQDPQILVNYTSDPDLKAESSESYTAGLVYSPSYIDGMSLTLDYWRFKIKDAISRLDVQAGLNACHAGDTTACETFGITPDGNLENLTNPLTNVGYQDTSGIDFNLAYRFEGLGLDWSISNDLTYLLEFEQDGIDYTGTIGGMFGGYAKVKNNFSVKAGQGDWSLMYSNRFIGEMDDINYGDTVDSVLYHNISGMYHINDSITASLGVKNFTDEKPVMVASGNEAGTVPEVYDTIGRQIYGGVTVKF